LLLTNDEELAMPQSRSGLPAEPGIVTADDVSRLLGALDERKTLDILALKPTLSDVEQAAVWLAGNGDVLARSGHPLAGVVADIVDILTADEEEPPKVH
jgi:hypothetical protein